MVGEAARKFGYTCITCNTRIGCHLSRLGAVRQAGDHAAQNGGHSVFLMHNGKSTLDVYWYPPHTINRLPGV
jgi:hypothetical protein